jgi:hypothetical protein
MSRKVGKTLFTLPICLRDPGGTGYPPSDPEVHRYFGPIMRMKNDLDIWAHVTIASFIAAAHRRMLEELKMAQDNGVHGREALLRNWHNAMEGEEGDGFRALFFSVVIGDAARLREELTVRHRNRIASGYAVMVVSELMGLLQLSAAGWNIQEESPTRDIGEIRWPTDAPEGVSRFEPQKFAQLVYNVHAAAATASLTKFISSLWSVCEDRGVCVTYFDESHNLGACYWTMMRLISLQQRDIPMWYVFMGTRTGYQLYSPAVMQCEHSIHGWRYSID